MIQSQPGQVPQQSSAGGLNSNLVPTAVPVDPGLPVQYPDPVTHDADPRWTTYLKEKPAATPAATPGTTP